MTSGQVFGFGPAGCTIAGACAIPVGLLFFAFIGLVIASLVYSLILLRRHRKCAPGGAMELSDCYRLIAQATGDIFFEYHPSTRRFLWASDLPATFLAYRPGELDLQEGAITNLVHPEMRELFNSAVTRLAEGVNLDLELQLRKANGDWCWVHLLAIPTENGRRVVGVARNTQEFHETQEELEEARRLEAVGTMAGGIAHEFNNHLTPVRGFIELALDHLDSDNPATDGLRTALDRVDYCIELVSQVLTYGRKTVLSRKLVELPKILPSIVRVAMSMSHKRSTKVVLEEQWPAGLPAVSIDQTQFQQAMVHLIRNSLQAMPNGGNLTIHAEKAALKAEDCVGKRNAKPGPYICVSVIDTGVGISPDNLRHIFEPFFTTHGLATARGMGLPIVQGIVEQHGGWIDIVSEVGRGTTVKMFFPIEKKEKSHELADAVLPVSPAAPVGRMLVADDEEFIRDIIRRVFEAESWKVLEASETATALKIIKDPMNGIDILVLDLTMPGPTSEEIITQAMATQPGLKILLISTFSEDARIQQIIEMDNVEFLAKPFTPKEILTKVDEMMTRRP